MGSVERAEAIPGLLAALVLAGVFRPDLGCAKDPVYESNADAGSGTGGAAVGGAAGGTAGAGGRGDYAAPACDPANNAFASTAPGKVVTASPLLSLGKPVKASAGATNPDRVVDGLYSHNGMSIPGAMLPGWVSINLGAGSDRLLLSWADTGYTDYNTISGRAPVDYQILTSADSTDGQDGAWTMVVSITGNTVRNRAHSFPFAGMSWVKLLVTAGAKDSYGTPTPVNFDEIELHDLTASGATLPADSWFFMGDSITAGAFRRSLGTGTTFDELIHAQRPDYRPIMLSGGIGGELSNQGLQHMPDWLALNPDIQHIAILYGTNDSWGDKPVAGTSFEANMTSLVDMIIAAGRVPVLARIPYSAAAPHSVSEFNAVIDRLSTSHGLPCGPDLYAWFRDHPEEISPNDPSSVHPDDVGYRSINRLWAQAMLGRYPPN
jgi:acyl-CoA thioesterase-1